MSGGHLNFFTVANLPYQLNPKFCVLFFSTDHDAALRFLKPNPFNPLTPKINMHILLSVFHS